MTSTAADPVVQGLKIQGNVHGGQQPVVGAHVYLFAANTVAGATNGGGGNAPLSTNASVSTLIATSTGTSDSVGAYVLTTAGGAFSITGDYSCTPNTQLYLYALGGNTGTSTANPAAGFLAALGNCPSAQSFAASTPFVFINEVSTVAAAYALAGYATDATHISSDVNPVARTGIANAFLNSPNLENIATGTALATTPAGNGTVPQALINTLANILSSCINSSNTAAAPSTQCTTLFANAQFSGSTGTTPTDTATAAINIAHNAGSNVATLFGLSPASPPFAPSLATAPNDFLVGINYNGQGASGGLNGAYSIAIDALGAAWFTNVNNNSITKLSSTGVPLSPAGGFVGGGVPTGIAIDPSGNAWAVDASSNDLVELSSSGAVLSPAGGYPGAAGGLMVPQGIAIDGQGNIFAPNFGTSAPASISKFNNSGTAVSPATGFTGGGLSHTTSIALDNHGSVWVGDQAPTPGTLSKFTGAGSPLSSAGFPGGGTNNPQGVATDSNSDVWVANYSGNSLTELSMTGTPISPSTGYTGGGLSNPKALAIDGNGNVWVANAGNSTISEFTLGGAATSPSTGFGVGGVAAPVALEIDQSGNVWVANNPPSGSAINSVTELIGAAVPRVVPLSVGVGTSTLGTRP